MVKIAKKAGFAGLPPTQRATSFVLGGDPKGKNFVYCSANAVIMRDIENPQYHESYVQHKKTPSCAKYSASGNYICSGDASGIVRIWATDQEDHILKNEFHIMGGKIVDLAWDVDSKRIAVCGEGKEAFGAAFLWDTGSSVGKITNIQKNANSVDIKRTRPYRLAIGSEDFKAYVFEGPPFKYTTTFDIGERFCTCVRYSSDGKYLAVSNADGHIYILDGKTSEYIDKCGDRAHDGGVYSLCFSPFSEELMSASADKSVKIWDIETRQQTNHFVMGKDMEDQQLACLWQGDHLISVSLSGEINYLDRNNPSKPLRVVTGHNKTIVCCVTNKKDAIYSASFEGRIVKWNTTTGEGTRFTGKGHGSKIMCMLFDDENNKIISCGMDNAVRFTDADSCDFDSSSVVTLESQPTSCCFTSDGAVVVACEKELVIIKGGSKVTSQPWSADYPAKITVCGSTLLASGKKEGTAHNVTNTCDTYNIDGCSVTKCDKKIPMDKSLMAAATSPDGSRLALADGKDILVYEMADGLENPKTLSGHSNSIMTLAWSPNGENLASGGTDSSVFIWDPTKGTSAKYYGAHPKKVVNGVAWLDDNTVVSVGEDCAVRQWSVTF